MKNLRDHIIEWLDSIGADELMKLDCEDWPIAITPDDIMRYKDAHLHLQLVPAYRHADGTYHTEADETLKPCIVCRSDCGGEERCSTYQSWLAHKEAK